ncbi:hypothetical protein HDU91_006589, partial [Kappamyces sp. JEL0680]
TYAYLSETEDNEADEFEELASVVAAFWSEPVVKAALSQALLPDTAPHFLDALSRIADSGYKPTNEDVLKLRTVTQNISETIFAIQKINFHFFDVSGLKHHRKYWMPYFDQVTSVLFIVAVSGYCQVMVEEETNRMNDALQVFKQIANHSMLAKPGIILFLNKEDVFKERFKTHPIKNYFPDYDGSTTNYRDGIAFFDAKFKSSVEDKSRCIVSHKTCATDTKTMKAIIDGMTQSIISDNFKRAGITD